jgi:hypothetical protein
MKTKNIFLVMFSYIALLLLGSCSEETDDLLDCIKDLQSCENDEGRSQELQDVIEVDSTGAVSRLPVRE